MALKTISSPLLSTPFLPCFPPPRFTQNAYKFTCSSTSSLNSNTGQRNEEIVIVGAGIAGLATALALHRLGIQSLVLEQTDGLRTGGTSLTLFKNGWSVLDVLGVGDQLRSQFLQIQGNSFHTLTLKSDQGTELRSFDFKDVDQSQEVRAVERRVLLQTLASELPSGSVQFSSKLAEIEEDNNTGETKLKLTNGAVLSAKIVIACDGIRSPIARWMGFPEPKYAGHCAFRGLAYYPEGQPYKPRVNYIYGRGLRAGFVPVSPAKVYWFICYNSNSPGPKITDPKELKKQALALVKNWPPELPETINITPEETISRAALEDRWLWPGLTPPVSKGGVVLVGDAWHPMTPNLGQGGCCALEDSVILAKNLSKAIRTQGTIKDAFRSYEDERWPRIFPLTIRANLVGGLLQWENPVICSLRNGIVIPKIVQLKPLLEHTNFSCEPL
ncbi:hypothetical protein KSS87_009576 [Heliosperma pusillum]|nr:hypothetical protein KSS87_009576 [Heliosperma pusillum]